MVRVSREVGKQLGSDWKLVRDVYYRLHPLSNAFTRAHPTHQKLLNPIVHHVSRQGAIIVPRIPVSSSVV